MIRITAIHTVTRVTIHHAPHAEHAGLVAYAASEVLHLSRMIWFIALWLTFTGLIALFLEIGHQRSIAKARSHSKGEAK